MQNLIFAILTFSLMGCATSHRGKVIEGAVFGSLAGAAFGLTRSDYREQNSMMFAGLGAGIGSVIAATYNDVDKKTEQLQKENQELKAKLDLLEKPVLTETGSSLFQSKLPKDLGKLIRPGEWKRYKIDYWVQDQGNANTWFRQTEMLEVIPPSTF